MHSMRTNVNTVLALTHSTSPLSPPVQIESCWFYSVGFNKQCSATLRIAARQVLYVSFIAFNGSSGEWVVDFVM